MLDYEELKKEWLLENISIVQKEYKEEDYQKKIDNYCEKFNISKEDIIKNIVDGDKITISIFAKDPNRQNFYEITAAEYISKIDGVSEFKNLPNSGKNTIFIDKDNIRKKTDYNGELPSKSIDFQWKFKINKIQYYAFHKYIKNNGGSQDNQFNDVIKSIMAAQSIQTGADHKVLFICDGDYFNEIKLKMLKNAVINRNHKVLNINEVEKELYG